MTNWIERYIHDVTRRLPEADREEVNRELQANIYDMLPENPSEEDIKAVLRSLGAPALLAEQYRQKPRYLISPALYGDYVHVLRWLLPLVGGICLVVGMVLGGVEAMGDGNAMDWPHFLRGVFGDGFSLGISGLFQALVWVTVGFVIAERTGYQSNDPEKGWKLEDLPEVPLHQKGIIPLSDSIAELIVSVVFTLIAILLFTDSFPFIFMIKNNVETQIYQLFTSDFLRVFIPIMVLSCALQVIESATKIAFRRWSPPVCAAVIVNNLVSIGTMLYLFTRPQIFSQSFLDFFASFEWGDALRIMGTSAPYPFAFLWIIGAIVVVAGLAECGTAIYRTAKASA